MTERVEKYRGNITPEEIVEKIVNSKSIILTVHTSPDGDALGSVLAFFLMIDEYNRKYIKNVSDFIKVKIVIDDKLPKYIGKFQENIFLETYERFSSAFFCSLTFLSASAFSLSTFCCVSSVF